MSDTTPQPPPTPTPAPPRWPRLEPGAVVAGRWIVRETLAGVGAGTLYLAADRRLGQRPCVLVAWPDVTAEALAAAWPTSSAPRAALVDVAPIAGGAIAIVALDEGADPVGVRPDLSREASARLAVELVAAVHLAESESVPLTQTGAGQLWCTGDPHAPRLLVVPVPRLDRLGDDAAAHHAGERAVLARRLAGWLYGVSETMSPADALERLPDTVRAVLAPLYADGPDERMAASLARDRFANAFGVSDGSRVPVPTGNPSGPAFGATWSSRAKATARRGWRQVAIAGGVIVTLAAALSSLLGGVEHPAVTYADTLPMQTEAAAPAAPPTPPSQTLPPAPIDLTPEIETWRDFGDTPTWYASIGEAPVPAGVTAMDAGTLAGLRGSHAVFTDSGGRVRRVEDFGPYGRFDGWREVQWSDDGMVATVSYHDTTARPLRTRVVDFAEGRITERYAGGASALDGCDALAVQFDDFRRPLEERCVDRDGMLVPFASGPHRITYEWQGASPLPIRTAFFDADGEPTVDQDGISSTNVTWDALGRESVRAFFGPDGASVRHPEIGAARVVTTWRANAVRTSLFDADQRPTRGPSGWHIEDVEWSAERTVRRSWYDTVEQPVGINGTPIAAEAMVVGDHGELLERRWIGVDGVPVTDLPSDPSRGVHRYTYVRNEHDDVLRECAWGVSGEPVETSNFAGAHCHYLQRDAIGRVIAEWRIGSDARVVPDASTGAERTVWTWSNDEVVTRVSWHRLDGAPMPSRRGGYAIRYAWHPSTGDRLRQTRVDLQGRPVIQPEGYSTVSWRYDARGRVFETCYARPGGLNDEPAYGDREQCMTTERDDRGRVSRLAWSSDRPIGESWPDRTVSTRVEAVEFVYVAGRVHQQLWYVGAQEPLVQRCAVDACVNTAGDEPLDAAW